MKIETKEIYKCEYCNKLYQIKRFCEQHEIVCHKNPDNYRQCLDYCPYLTKKDATVYFDNYRGEEEATVAVFYCEKRDCYLYPPKVEHKNNAYDIDNNEPMPKNDCKVYIEFRKETKQVGFKK